MGVHDFFKSFFGVEKDRQQSVSHPLGRKRLLDEEEEGKVFEFSKNSLNRPVKRARMEDNIGEGPPCDRPAAQALSPFRKIYKVFKTIFLGNEVKAGTTEEFEVNGGDRENGGSFDPIVETVDLTEDDDENKENLPVLGDCPVLVPSLMSSSSRSTLNTLSSFTGFTSVAPSSHVVTTSLETDRRQEANSPEKVRMRLMGGRKSKHDNFFNEKDISRRKFRKPSEFGGVIKSGKKRTRTAFQHTAQLQEREKYRLMLERFGVVKYSALLNFNSCPIKTSSFRRPGSLQTSAVDDIVDVNPLTSTVVKPGLSSPSKLEQLASPVLSRDKSSLRHSTSVRDSKLAADLSEVTSPQYLKNLYKNFGAKTREREMQIQREEDRKKQCEKDTEEVADLIQERLESHLKITQVCVLYSPLSKVLTCNFQAAVTEDAVQDSQFDESQPTDLPDLTSEMTAVVKRAKASRGEVLVDAHKIQITVKDIDTLSGLNWLNDEIINFYMQMIVERAGRNAGQFPSVYAFTTFFYPRLMEKGFTSVKRWTKKVDVFSYDILIIPVHLGMHWCLAAVNMKGKIITYYDSMGGKNTVRPRF